MDKNIKYIHSSVRVILGIIFLLSAIGKIADFSSFALFIGKLLPITDVFSILISSVIIGTELLIGSFLFLKLHEKEASIIAGVIIVLLFIPFTIYTIINDINLSCGCFGVIESLNSDNNYINLSKNILLLLGIVFNLNNYVAKKSNYKIISLYSFLFIFSIFWYNYNFLSHGLSLVESVDIEQYMDNPNEYILVDARDHSIYLEEHIPDAISIPYIGEATDLTELNTFISINRSKKILTYCDATSCTLSKLLALRISTKYKIPTYELQGGIEEWKKFIN